MTIKQKQRTRKKSKPEAIKIPTGWNTTDEDEINRRRLRAESEPMKVENLNPEDIYFSNFRINSNTDNTYHVEIRSLQERLNSCSCADYNSNGLGTCKHIEKVLLLLKKKGKRRFKEACLKGSEKAEIYVHPLENQIKVIWPHEKVINSTSHRLLKDVFSANGSLLADARTAMPVILRHLNDSPETIGESIRISKSVHQHLVAPQTFSQKMEARNFFLSDVEAGKHTLDFTKLPLYDYQKQGMLHLAFLEKAILADEMGLGKTVQAVAAAELLRKTQGIRKVLVVTPTSLKAEWEEQIAKFVDSPSMIIYGNRHERLHQYQKESFFYLTNYEQVVRDREEIQRLIAPDLVILDEAQRIKNWRTKTASTLKQLQSSYAFVLTGTPIENRLDDIYSLVQFLYPKLFGPLFRFNRDFYQLDEAGKPIGYKNLHLLHERLKPILLRRLKKDVEGQLPNRTINTYFIPMSSEQWTRYEEYEDVVARIAARGGKRPLTEEEFRHLQMSLANMRMVCDTPYILDEDCRICPKLNELESILEELFQDPTTKIIIFSEWERMLYLVRDLLDKLNIGYAWHTGSVNQVKRRGEINHFKNAEDRKVFLSTDCGAVGLNLQAANVVINLDLPWNPAKLEQRIARAWRKHQTRTVQVINLVSEDTIEHRMLGVLNLKQRLSDNVLDLGTVEQMDMPSGRKAFMKQLKEIIGNASSFSGEEQATTVPEDPVTQFQQETLARFKPRLHRFEIYQDDQGTQTILTVVDGDLTHPKEQMHKLKNELDPSGALQLEVLDRATYEIIQRLCKAGILSFHQDQTKLISSQESAVNKHQEQQKRLKAAQKYLDHIERKERMVSLLLDGEFYEESLPPLREAFELSLQSLAELYGYPVEKDAPVSLNIIREKLVAEKNLSNEALTLASQLRTENIVLDQEKALELFLKVQAMIQFLARCLNKINLNAAA